MIDKNLRPAPSQEQKSLYGGGDSVYGPLYGQGGEYYGEENTSSSLLGEMSIARIACLIRKKWIMLCLTMVFGLCCSVFYLTKTTPIYKAVALIEMSVRKPRILNYQGAVLDDHGYVPREEIINTRLAKFHSERMKEIAAMQFRELCKDKSFSVQESRKAIVCRISFKPKEKTRLVIVSCENTDPDITAIVANSYARAAERITIEENTILSNGAVAWLKEQATTQEKVLLEIENDIVMLKIKNDLQAVIQERRILFKSYTVKHLKIVEINTRIDSLKKQLMGHLDSSHDKIEVINNELASMELSVTDYPSKLLAVERERDVCDMTYRSILKRIEEARLSTDEDTAIVKIINIAKKPSAPIHPKKTNILLTGLIMGLVGGFMLAFITDTVEDHVTSYTDVESLVGLKVIGLLPHVSKVERENLALTSLDSKFGAVSEAMAGIRTVLGSPRYQDMTDSILVTSSVPAEGKTIIASNLAIVSAKSGAKTLLVDFDMRRPKIAGIFGDPGKENSLLHILNTGDTARFSDLPKYGKCDGLSVITSSPSGNISPAEILGGRHVTDFLTWAKENYDRVIIDSPPFGIVGDAGVLACLVSSVILVCRPEQSRRRGIRHVVKQLNNIGANIIGVIVNDVDFTKQGYFSNYYHYSYHNYQYSKYYRADVK